ncbi:MAG: type II toxin-antitoxin system RelB/DinJ family antitoxin [Bacteroides sp.]|nr:type II toxin-antitoxin system RelB/DinJ family antitoxin [Bacteroides sp.]
MADKTATVSVRLQPEIKKQAEDILGELGIPVSVLIDSLYRQIVMTKSIPYSFAVPIPTRSEMSKQQFDEMMRTSLFQAKSGQGLDVDAAFSEINKRAL